MRALHDRLSEYLDRVEQGVEIVVTRRGRRVARLSAIGRDEALAELVRRGLVRLPERPRSRRRASVAARGSVSELVAEQRRSRLYLDTSALIKLIVAEDGSDVAAELWNSYPAACGVLAYPEARAALAAARRARRRPPAPMTVPSPSSTRSTPSS